jgi:hypothetical protein
MDSDSLSEGYPEWRPFDCNNRRFVKTPAMPRLAPPVMLGKRTIVFPKRYPEWLPFDGNNMEFMQTPAMPRLVPPVMVGKRAIVFGHPLRSKKP